MSSYEIDHNIISNGENSSANSNNLTDEQLREQRRRAIADHFVDFFAAAPEELNHTLNSFGVESPLVRALIAQLQEQTENNGRQAPSGVSDSYLDSLVRVSRPALQKTVDEKCAICACRFLDDEYPLVVELPCPGKHRFDLECVGPWLKLHASCPLCRKDLLKPKEPIAKVEEDTEEDFDDMYS